MRWELGLDGWVDVCGAFGCVVDHRVEFEGLRWSLLWCMLSAASLVGGSWSALGIGGSREVEFSKPQACLFSETYNSHSAPSTRTNLHFFFRTSMYSAC